CTTYIQLPTESKYLPYTTLFRSRVLVAGRRLAARDDQHELAEQRDRLAECEPDGFQRAAKHLLVNLRELARDARGAARAERTDERVDRLRHTVDGLEEDEGSLLVRKHGEPGVACLSTAGQEALEHVAIGRQPGHGQRGRHGARPGDRAHVDSGLERALDEPPPGIADQR